MSVGNAEEFDSTLSGVVDETSTGVSDEEMTEVDEATTDDGEQMPDAEVTTPPKGFVSQKQIDELRSAKDKEVAAERRERLALEAQLNTVLAEREKIELENLNLRTENMTEEQQEIAKERYELAKERRALEAEKQKTLIGEAMNRKAEAARYYSATFGIPEEKLMRANSPEEMKLLAELLSEYTRAAARTKRTEQGTDKLESGPGGRGGPVSFQAIEAAYARHPDDPTIKARYAAARQKAGID